MPGFLTGGALAERLVLNRWLLAELGVEDFEELKNLLRQVEEGPGDGGQSNYYGRLASQPGRKLGPGELAAYDRRVLAYEQRLVPNCIN